MELIVDMFVMIWYTFLLGIAGMIYFFIFKYFTKIGGGNKAAKLLGAPGIDLKEAMHRNKDADAGFLSFIGYFGIKWNERNITADDKWIKYFFEVCHWCGYQVMIIKESEGDIEDPSSKAYDEKLVEKLSNDLYAFDEKSIKQYNKSIQHVEKVKSKFEL